MSPGLPMRRLSAPLQLYTAMVMVRLAIFVLWFSRCLYRKRFLGVSGIEWAVHLSETLRRCGWRLMMRTKRRTSAPSE